MGIIWLKVKIADTSFKKGKYKIKRTELANLEANEDDGTLFLDSAKNNKSLKKYVISIPIIFET